MTIIKSAWTSRKLSFSVNNTTTSTASIDVKMTTYVPSLTIPGIVFEKPALAILLPVILGTGVGFSVQPRQTQKTYLALRQPPFRPPPWVFGPVWTCLYAGMGYASYRAWMSGTKSIDPRQVSLAKQGATLYTIQLALNLIWMPLFFGLKRPIEATADIVALTSVTGYLAYIWSQVDEVSTYTLVPYLGWLSFATYLTVSSHARKTFMHLAYCDNRLVRGILTTGTSLAKSVLKLHHQSPARPSMLTRSQRATDWAVSRRECEDTLFI